MKKNKLLPLLLIAIMVLTGFAVIACRKPAPVQQEGTGIYYCDAAGGTQHLLILHGINEFTISVNSETKTGTYALDGETLVLDFAKDEDGEITATLASDIISLNYSGSSIRFYKQTVRTVSFNPNQGNAVASIQVLNGTSIPLNKKPAPTRSGYTLVGWYDSSLTTEFVFGSSIVTGDITLYAYWGDNIPGMAEFKVDFDLNYPEAADTAAAVNNFETKSTIGGRLYDLPVPTLEGYTFQDWWVSMFDNAGQLTHRFVAGASGTELKESTTLFALWRVASTSSWTPFSPLAEISSGLVTWPTVANASSYKIEVANPAGTVIASNNSLSATTTSFSFATASIGTYTSKITAVGSSDAYVSETAVRYYNHNALARVSLFSIVDSSVLIFNPVANAAKYLITVDCGNKLHNHNDIDIGTSTSYNFAGCEMQPGGIKFTVKAVANGWITSTSKACVHVKDLLPVNEFRTDAATQTLYWNAVADASSYIAAVMIGGTEYQINNGNNLGYSLKYHDAGEIKVRVRPQTAGYNSDWSEWQIYTKTNLATPKNVGLAGNTVSWDSVTGATSYTIKIGGLTIAAGNTTSYELTSAEQTTLKAISGDYTLSVCANGATPSSLFSDGATVSNSVFSTVFYSAGYVYWNYVLGAAKYEVTVSGGESHDVIGANKFRPTLSQDGINTITVIAYGESGSALSGTVASTQVYAYKVEFDSRGVGSLTVDTLYKAAGDPVDDFYGIATRQGFDFENWYTAPGGAAQNAARYLSAKYTIGDLVLYAYWTPQVYTINLDAGEGTLSNGLSTGTAEVTYDGGYVLETPAVNGNGFAGWFSQPDDSGVQYTEADGTSLDTWIDADADGMTLYAHYAEVLIFLENYDIAGNLTGYNVTSGADIDMVTSLIVPDTYNGLPVVKIDVISSSQIESITIGKNINDLDTKAFDTCAGLTNIYVVSANSVYSDINGILCNKAKTQLIAYPQARTAAVIPSGITTINSYAFKNCTNLTEITVPSTVKTILYHAFYNCNLVVSINLSKGLTTIDAEAFYGCSSLEEITIPADVTTLGEHAFYGCTSLSRMVFAGGSTLGLTLGDYIFSDCPMLSDLVFESGSKVQNISSNAFDSLTAFTEITIPSSVTTIADFAFENCTNLEKIIIAAGSELATIGKDSFKTTINTSNSKLKEVIFEGSTKLTAIHDAVFKGITSLKTIILPSGLTSVNSYAFQNCTNLEVLTFRAGSFKTIGTGAFAGCVNLTYLTLPAIMTTTLSADFFGDCVNLKYFYTTTETSTSQQYLAESGVLYNANKTSLVCFPAGKNDSYILPYTITNIENQAFRNSSLEGISVAAGNISYTTSNGALMPTDGLTLIFYPSGSTATSFSVPNTVTTIDAYAFSNCRNLVTIEIPNSVTRIGTYAFNGCSSLSSLTLPTNLEFIGNYAFNGCTNLTTMALPENTLTIGAGTFAGITSLITINIPSSVTTIGANAFNGCTGLQSVTFTNATSGLTSISDNAFQGCTALKSFTLPVGLETIGNYAFQGCTSLPNPSFPISLTTIGNYAYQGCTGLITITITTGIESIGDYAFADCVLMSGSNVTSGIRIVTFNSDRANPLSIGAYAFSGNKRLTTINFKSANTDAGDKYDCNVKSIGDYAFYNCNNPSSSYSLSSVTFPSSLETIGNYAFANCATSAINSGKTYYYGLATIGLNEGLVSIGKYAFSGNILGDGTNKTLNIPSSVTSIGDSAFVSDNFYITSVIFTDTTTNPGKLKSIGNYAFHKLTSITSMTLPRSLETIGDYAFGGEVGGITASGIGVTGMLTIPDNVTKIGAYAFINCSGFTGLTLGSSVAKIDANAFAYCGNMKNELILPASLTDIGDYAFLRTGFTGTLTLPSTLKNIGSYCFSGNRSSDYPQTAGSSDSAITEVIIEKGGITTIPNSLFRNQPLTKVTISASIQSIDAYAFLRYSNPTEYTLIFESGSSLKNISSTAFTVYGIGGPVKIVNIPDSLVSAKSIFKNSGTVNNEPIFGKNVTEFELSADASSNVYSVKDGVIFDKAGTTLLCYPTGKIGAYTVPDGTTSIGDYAFLNCTLVSGVTISASVIAIGAYAFDYCTSLKSVTFNDTDTVPSMINRIGNYAFNKCSLLESINIPNSLSTIGTEPFKDCAKLSYIDVKSSNATFQIDDGFFVNKSTGIIVYIVKEITGGEITIPSSVTVINSSLFYGRITDQDNLAVVNIHAGVKIIEDYAFYGCTALTTVNIENTAANPSQLTNIGSSAFQGCFRLDAFSIPAGVVKIGTYAFYNCGLKELNFEAGSNLVEIGAYAFSKNSFTSVVLPDKLTTLGSYAFSSCTLLSRITLSSRLRSIGEAAFSSCSGLSGEIKIPASVVNISTQAFNGCSGISKVTFADNSQLNTIGLQSFQGCSGLVAIDFGRNNALKTIVKEAFSGCSILTEFTMPLNVNSLGFGIFQGCTKLAKILVESGNSNYVSENGILFDTSKSTLVLYPYGKIDVSYTVPSGVTVLAEGAFNGGNTVLQTIILPDTLKTIRALAITYGFNDITIPSSVTRIENTAFWEYKNKIYIQGRTRSQAPSGWNNWDKLDDSTTIWNVVTNPFDGTYIV